MVITQLKTIGVEIISVREKSMKKLKRLQMVCGHEE